MYKAAIIGSYLVGGASAVLGITETINQSLEARVPGFDPGNMGVSWSEGCVAVAGCLAVADKLEQRGRVIGAERLRRWSGVVASAGSVVAQAILEGGFVPGFGSGDYREALFGLIATVPGIIAGRSAYTWIRSS